MNKTQNSVRVVLVGLGSSLDSNNLNTLLRTAEGLSSLFPEENHIVIDDFTSTIVSKIAKKIATDQSYTFENGLEKKMDEYIQFQRSNYLLDEGFGHLQYMDILFVCPAHPDAEMPSTPPLICENERASFIPAEKDHSPKHT